MLKILVIAPPNPKGTEDKLRSFNVLAITQSYSARAIELTVFIGMDNVNHAKIAEAFTVILQANVNEYSFISRSTRDTTVEKYIMSIDPALCRFLELANWQVVRNND